jgi:hypothetical protein
MTPLPSTPLRLLAHVVGAALGVRGLRTRTLVVTALALWVGLPLLAAVVENVVAGTFEAALCLAAVSAVLVVTSGRLIKGDIEVEAARQAHERAAPARPRRALVMACSRPPATTEQLGLLTRGDASEALRRLSAEKPPWVELLARTIAFHAPECVRVILFVDPTIYTGKDRVALVAAAEAWLRRHPDRALRGGVVTLVDCADMNDAELVRAKALGVLAELGALGVPAFDVAILVSLGTSAVTAARGGARARRAALRASVGGGARRVVRGVGAGAGAHPDRCGVAGVRGGGAGAARGALRGARSSNDAPDVPRRRGFQTVVSVRAWASARCTTCGARVSGAPVVEV